jgi:hypothetical protein
MIDDAALSDRWLGASQAMAVALVGAVAHSVAIALVPHQTAVQVVGLGATVCYAIYLGFALTRGEVVELLTELSFCTVGLVLVGLGLWADPVWLAAAWALHGCWDLLHHADHHVIGTRGVPRWYVPLCAFFDFPVAVSILLLL